MKFILLFIFGFLVIGCNSKCENGIQDGKETDVDCGGKCWSCYIDPDPGECDQTPDLFGQLYCVYPDTNGFGLQAPLDTNQGPLFFMFTYINTSSSSSLLLPVCDGTIVVDNSSLNGPIAYWEISKFTMELDQINGGYDFTYLSSTYWAYNDKCRYTSLSVNGVQCDWFSNFPPPNDGTRARIYFVDLQDSIYVISELDFNIPLRDTLTYYSIII